MFLEEQKRFLEGTLYFLDKSAIQLRSLIVALPAEYAYIR
jgi:hypothetical protein